MSEQYEGGIVWREEKAAMGGTLLCTEWADLEARVGQVVGPPHGLFFFVQLGRFPSEYDAKMFAEEILKMRFESKIASGEAEPMEGHHDRQESQGWLRYGALSREGQREDHPQV